MTPNAESKCERNTITNQELCGIPPRPNSMTDPVLVALYSAARSIALSCLRGSIGIGTTRHTFCPGGAAVRRKEARNHILHHFLCDAWVRNVHPELRLLEQSKRAQRVDRVTESS